MLNFPTMHRKLTRLVLIVPVLIGICFAQPSLVSIVDTVYDQTGHTVNGSLQLSLSVPSSTASGSPVVSLLKTLQISNGRIVTSLIPNSTITPSGSFYILSFSNGATLNCIFPLSGSPIGLGGHC